MQLPTASAIASPILTATFLCANGAQAQIQPGGYTCNGDITRTHNNSLAVIQGHGTCQIATSWAHWYNLAKDFPLAGQYTRLKCVDWSFHSSNNPWNQVIFIRVWQDLTPESRDGTCADPDTPGPDVASALLLWEETTIIPPSTESICSFGDCPPRADGDRSTEITGQTGGGLLLPPDIAFFVEVGHAGEAVTRFGTNYAGEYGDIDDGPEQSWIKAPNCNAGGCSSFDWVKHSEWNDDPRDFVMQVNIDVFECSCPPPLPFCSTDITGENDERDGQTDVLDLVGLLSTWGELAPPRPLGDVAPLPYGNNYVDVTDLVAMLASWGPCSTNPREDCQFILQTWSSHSPLQVGSNPFVIDGYLDGPSRPATNDLNDILNGPTQCGWFDYGVNGIPGGFRYGDTFGVDTATGQTGGDIWFLYRTPYRYDASCPPLIISTQSDCAPGDINDTIIEVYDPTYGCPDSWLHLIACDDSSATGCGDHARIELDIVKDYYLIRVAGKFGEQGSGVLTIQPQFDCNTNGVPDSCDIGQGISTDCDSNGIPDECEKDCDGDGVNDACQAQFLADSGPISPFGGATVTSILIQDLPPAQGDVTYAFFASADLADVVQAVDMYMDGYYMTTVFIDTAGPCSFPGDREDFIYDSAFFNLLHTFDGNPDALIELVPVGVVDPFACWGDSFIQLTLKYFTDPTPTNNGTTQDCNANGVWDVCDIEDGFSLDHQGNGVPDGCEIKFLGRFEHETSNNPD